VCERLLLRLHAYLVFNFIILYSTVLGQLYLLFFNFIILYSAVLGHDRELYLHSAAFAASAVRNE